LVSFRLIGNVAFTSQVAGDALDNQNITAGLTHIFVLVGRRVTTVETLVGELAIIVDEDIFEYPEVGLGVSVGVG
jgi:hypothetical protein